MSNKPTWYENSPWGKRAPRQDRRVVVNGKFVELTAPIPPTPESEVNTALEVVQEIAQKAIDEKQAPLSPKEIHDLALQIVIDQQVEKAAEELGWKETVNESSESEKLQAELEPLPTTETDSVVLPTPVEVAAGEGVLDGQAGRTEEAEEESTESK